MMTGFSKRLIRAHPYEFQAAKTEPAKDAGGRTVLRTDGPRGRRQAKVCSRLGSYGHHPMALPRPLHVLALGHLEALDHDRPRLARVDHVVDHRVPGRDVGV